MKQHLNQSPNYARIWRIIARFWGTLAAGFWVFMVIGEGLSEGISEIEGEGAVLGVLIILIAILTVLAWRWEKEAGALLLLAGVALSLFALNTAGRNHIFAMLVSGAPFILSGFLFMASASLNEGEG